MSFDLLQEGRILGIGAALFSALDQTKAHEFSGRYREAITLTEDRLRQTPLDFPAALDLARLHMLLNEFAEAEKYFQNAINNPLLEGIVVASIHAGYAQLLEKLGRHNESLDQLLIVFKEQKRRNDEESNVTMERLQNLAAMIGISPETLKKRIRSGFARKS